MNNNEFTFVPKGIDNDVLEICGPITVSIRSANGDSKVFKFRNVLFEDVLDFLDRNIRGSEEADDKNCGPCGSKLIYRIDVDSEKLLDTENKTDVMVYSDDYVDLKIMIFFGFNGTDNKFGVSNVFNILTNGVNTKFDIVKEEK